LRTFPQKGGGNELQSFWTLLRIDRTNAKNAVNGLKKLPKKSNNPGVKVYYIASVFGEWDNCVWFEANDHEHAIGYVQNTLSKIPGVVDTYTLPMAPIKEYYKQWK
jgi:uncharacterized protein with GYD domain